MWEQIKGVFWTFIISFSLVFFSLFIAGTSGANVGLLLVFILGGITAVISFVLLVVIVSACGLGYVVNKLFPPSSTTRDDDQYYNKLEDKEEFPVATVSDIPITGDHFVSDSQGFCRHHGRDACKYCARRVGSDGKYHAPFFHCHR